MPKGGLSKGTTSNIFFVKNGTLVTPPESAGILLGITRQKLFCFAEREGIPVEEKMFFPDELARADEAFISSSIREVFPVVTIDGRRSAAESRGLRPKSSESAPGARSVG
jgi:branched-subunit amino acid aminotransferase/4-amino-4-deoxychorismate lyase